MAKSKDYQREYWRKRGGFYDRICPICGKTGKDFAAKMIKYCSQECQKKGNEKYLKENDKMIKERNIKHRAKIRAMVIKYYGGECQCCGEKNHKFLTIDHKNNDGTQDRREWKSQNSFLLARRKGYPNDIELACYNCNLGRERNNGICPHKE